MSATHLSRAVLAISAALFLACGARTGIDAPDAAVVGGCPHHVEISYLFDAVGTLYRYDPITGELTLMGTPNCSNGNVAWTMTVSREAAYIVYTDWTIYRVDLGTLACTPTAFRSGQLGIDYQFGVAVLADASGERLYVYGQPTGASSPILAVGDLSSFSLSRVGDVVPAPPYPVNLTADSMGHLYAFAPGGLLAQIDSRTGAVQALTATNVITMSTWAQITHGGLVYLFVGSRVDGYDLATGTSVSSRDIGIYPIGAGTVLVCDS